MTSDPVDPTPLAAVASGFMAAKQLFAASELGVFAALGAGATTTTEVADAAGLPERSARVLLDAMVGLGLVSYVDGAYRNTDATAAYLSGGAGLDLRPWLAFWDTLSYPHWLGYTDSMRTAEPQPFDMGGERMGTFMGGVQTYNSLHAQQLAGVYDFTPHRNLLDLAGLSTAFLDEAHKRNPLLRGAFVSTDMMLQMAKAGAPAGFTDFVEFHEADPLTTDVPGHYDAVLLEHVLHRFTPQENKTILTRARSVVDAGATLLVLDFLLDPSDGRRLDPVLAGEYLVIDGTVVYPEDEVRSWLADTGWRWVETRPVPASPRVLIAEAV
ncbi:acetylserotonin O-methyltransferase [Actinokineospora globicatena]|uniref:acetylserotonin O-methyltransferase n=1 Tax=Actinokineospora globicatena TaxID=103729 RepID=UPI0020A4B4EC|nr:acetylserotonin O-methyltransferase [Actinokineospora globicatena]MCP2306261.1 O-methyltransferase [Actinokineospora globicatena]GLW81686.1 hydroxyindole O-methyltransferase [Actinokineospora globicatena]GLW88481.1 hydroxyindole O-methyltransferase [Actinokineospora globicatena]